MQATGRAAGISSKEIERLAKIATDAANQATPEWQRLSKAISDATDAEQLRKFGEEARQAMNAGKISAEQYADVLKQVENQQKQLNQAKERQASAERRAASAMQASTQAMAQNTQKTRENTEATKENANAKTSLESLKKDWSTQSEKLFDDFGLTEDQRNELKQRALDIADWGNAATENTSFNELKIKARAYRRQNQREKAKEKAQASQQNINDEIAKALADLPPPTIQIDGKALAQTVSNHIAQREQHLVKAVGERVTTDLTNEINSALKAGGGYSY
ncbi:MAG: hypothetical protein CR974_02020 [Gammaproteobacteria bacterium]|nr:MAG: hypothetical protein CR974_02020 [Gammaproteobacteria bacterium]